MNDNTVFDWDTLSIEDRKLWCKGFAKGDGCLNGGNDHSRPNYIFIRLCGAKIKYADRFKSCGYTVTNFGDGDDLLVYMPDNTNKDIPFYSLNCLNMKYYINGLMCADGGRRKPTANSEFRNIQVTGELNNYIYDMLNMSGYFVNSMRNLTGQITNYGLRKDITIEYGVSSYQIGAGVWRVANIEPDLLNPKAEVWCLEVDDNHSFVLEGGIATGNCCLARIGDILKGGFEMGNVWYNEPKTLEVGFDVISDVVISAASQQYGGFTIPQVDFILEPYAEKSYNKFYNEYVTNALDVNPDIDEETLHAKADAYAEARVYRDFEQGFQSWEYRFNTVGSSRGDYPFIATSFGLNQSRFGRMATEVILRVRKNGQGKKGKKKIVLFPKLTFLYDENLHGIGAPMEDLFNEAIECSKKSMYPDFLSLTGEGYIPSIYKKYGKVISLMGERILPM